MPFYDLHCPECAKDFTVRATVAEKTEKRILCPECGSNQLETIFSPIHFQVKSSAPPACPNSHVCGANCHHA